MKTIKHIKKSFRIIVKPTKFQDNINGYVATHKNYQTWNKTREGAIKDILLIVEKEQGLSYKELEDLTKSVISSA